MCLEKSADGMDFDMHFRSMSSSALTVIIRPRMKIRVLSAILVMASAAYAQTGQSTTTSTPQQQDLPAAPSASKQFPGATPQQAPAQTQAPATQNAPAPSTTPANKPHVDTSSDDVPIPESKPNAPAQQPSGSSQTGTQAPQQKGEEVKQNAEGEFSISRNVNVVNTVFTVTDKHGRFIKDLKESDFKIVDDGKPPVQIQYFAAETGLPLRVGLLVDASNSIRDRFRFEQESAIEFLNQIVRRNSDQAFVIGFDSTPEVKQDFTDDTNKLAAGVRDLRPGGGTALYDAVYYACRDKLADARSNKGPVRRAIILLSDGEDNQSRVLREEAVEMAERAEVIIYAISTNISGIKTRGDKVLERFAEMTGGRVFFPYKLQDVADAFVGIQEELRSQYAVGYKPADFLADGRYRTVSIEPVKGKNVKVRTRKGYYAPKK